MSPFPLTGRRNGLISPQSHSSTSPPVSKSQLSKEEKFGAWCGLEDWGHGKGWHAPARGGMRRDVLCVLGRAGSVTALGMALLWLTGHCHPGCQPLELAQDASSWGAQGHSTLCSPPLIRYPGGYSEVRCNQAKFYILFFTLQN